MRKLVLYISMSVDGYLATKDDDLSWLSIVEKEGEDYGYHDFYKDADAYIVGKTTYDTILKLTGGKFPQAENLDCYVITRQNIADEENITFYSGDIEQLIHKLKSEQGKNIMCDGGGQIVKMLMEKNLIDEYIISVIPIFLGDGKRLFIGGIDTINLKALPVKSFDSGLVRLHYTKQ
ncbi:dihydrofolate reductase [Elizabethkingia anophelis]|nr:dihydrofolate reductase [Elizabethkingia anophelis]